MFPKQLEGIAWFVAATSVSNQDLLYWLWYFPMLPERRNQILVQISLLYSTDKKYVKIKPLKGNLKTYLKGLSATALVRRATVLPSSSVVSTGQSEHWVSNISLTLNSSNSEGEKIGVSLSFWLLPLLFAAFPVHCWRNLCLSFRARTLKHNKIK